MRTFLTILPLIYLTGCWLTPERVNYDDSRLQPLFEAINEVDRNSLGFTKINSSDDIQIEEQSLFDKPYDVMLHIYGKTSRTISFEKSGSEIQWIGEQEIHNGPREYTTPDGTFNESITITYETKPISGHKLNTVNVGYLGPDSKILGYGKLTLGEAQNMINSWNGK